MRRPHNGRTSAQSSALGGLGGFSRARSLLPPIEVESRLPRAAKGDRLGGETEFAHDYGGREGQRAGGGQSVGRRRRGHRRGTFGGWRGRRANREACS